MLIMIISACKKSNENEKAVSLMFNDLKQVLTVQDLRYGYYEEALILTEKYINNPKDELLQTAVTACTTSIKNILDLEVVSCELERTTKSTLMELGVDITDLQIPYNMQNIDKSYKIWTLMDIVYLLERE